MLAYPVELEPDGDTIMATVPDIPGVHTFGATEAEALARCVGAIEEMLAARMCDREAIPAPSPPAGRPIVTLPPLTALKVVLYQAMQDRGVHKADLARLLGAGQKQVDRLLDLNHHSRLDQIAAALAVLGKRVTVQVEDADSRPVAA